MYPFINSWTETFQYETDFGNIPLLQNKYSKIISKSLFKLFCVSKEDERECMKKFAAVGT